MDGTLQRLQADAVSKYVFKEYGIEVAEKEVIFANGNRIKSESLAKHFAGCIRCSVVAATLGIGIDRAIKRLQFTNMANALLYDASANALIEKICDQLQEQIAVLAKRDGLYITSRYSPGYGDFALDNQPLLLKLAGAEKEAGITVSSSNLLIPQKSVTALIGYRPENIAATGKCAECPSRAKCKKETYHAKS